MYNFFATTTRRGNRGLPLLRVCEKAERLETCSPTDINLPKDKVDWATFHAINRVVRETESG